MQKKGKSRPCHQAKFFPFVFHVSTPLKFKRKHRNKIFPVKNRSYDKKHNDVFPGYSGIDPAKRSQAATNPTNAVRSEKTAFEVILTAVLKSSQTFLFSDFSRKS